MPNWCYNTITLSGKYKNFAKQLEKHDYSRCGFEFVKDGRCIFSLEKIEEGMYSFESKWAPPIEELCIRAKRGGFSFELDFEELGCWVYGKAIFNKEDNSLIEYYLPEETMRRGEVTDDGVFLIDGKESNICEWEFYEYELEKFINGL